MLNIAFFGTPQFAKIILQQLFEAKEHQKYYQITKVFAKRDSKTANFALEKGLTLVSPNNKNELILESSKTNADYFIVAAYGFIFDETILNTPKFGCFNVHGSLLPKYRGPSPIQEALLQGDTKTGVSIIKMDRGVDTGNLLAKKGVEIEPSDNFETLSHKIAFAGAELLLKNLLSANPSELKLAPQKGEASYTKQIKKEDGFVSAKDLIENPSFIYNKKRAFTPWPGIFTTLSELIKFAGGKGGDTQKRVIISQISTQQNSLTIEKLRLEGKNEISWKQFENGYLKG